MKTNSTQNFNAESTDVLALNETAQSTIKSILAQSDKALLQTRIKKKLLKTSQSTEPQNREQIP